MGLPEKCELVLPGRYRKGRRNHLTDVSGIRVGHVTLDGRADLPDVHTGVTAILPHGGNLYEEKVAASAHVINGFGKSIGLLQIEELGTIESPILLTNTMSVGTAYTAGVRFLCEENPAIGITKGTANVPVFECNDGKLSDIRRMAVTEEDVLEAIRRAEAGQDLSEGSVGAGTGMCCLGMKGGIGSSSRVLCVDGSDRTIGVMVLSNFGAWGRLIAGGRPLGAELAEKIKAPSPKEQDRDQGSIILLIATDLPMTARQLNRLSKRAPLGLGRVGSFAGNGSGDIAVAFSTANRVSADAGESTRVIRMVRETELDAIFEATVEAVEEAILSALWHAETMTGVRGTTVPGLRDCLKRLQR